MSIRTIQSKSDLEDLTNEFTLVIVAALRAGFAPGDMEFERLAQENGSGGDNVVFAKFIIEEAPELAEDFEIDDIAAVATFYRGEKDETVSGFEPPRWERVVMEALSKAG
ncbi:thioredoxin trx1 [Fusarium equiseti]|uniref:Thioredoxin trx1 n=1 Tax=Fusarium equiseti TaxID=61235 RepID=A0ABQ8R518_FUSEQ|nr:thioredoxin trx1 [Fusarium equiseti]